MAVDWTAVAAEVDAAIKSVGETDEGFPAALRQAGTPTGTAHDPTPGTPTYTTLRIIDSDERLRDRDGTLIDATQRTLIVATGAGVVPTDEDSIAVGITAGQANANSDWHAIKEVRPLAPAGVAVLYEVDLVN